MVSRKSLPGSVFESSGRPAVVAALLAVAFATGCTNVPKSPPRTLGTGLIGYATECFFLPEVARQTGGAPVKCSLAKVIDKSAYRFGPAVGASAENLFETMVAERGHQIAAKEAVDVIIRKVGLQDTSELFDPENATKFAEAIQQDGRSIVDYLLVVSITGVSPELQVQAKIVSARAGADWAQQIVKSADIDWKQLCRKYGVEHSSRAWSQYIVETRGCGDSAAGLSSGSGSGSGPGSGGPTAPPPTPPAAGASDVLFDLEEQFLPKLADVGGAVALFPPLYQKDDGAWITNQLGEEIARGAAAALERRWNVPGLTAGELEGALQSDGNRTFHHFCSPESARLLGQRIFAAHATVYGEIEKVKPGPFTHHYRVRLWGYDWLGQQIAEFERDYGAQSTVGRTNLERAFEFAAKRPVCDRAAPIALRLEDEIAWALDDTLHGLCYHDLLPPGGNISRHPSSNLRVNKSARTLLERSLTERRYGVLAVVEFQSQGKSDFNPSTDLQSWVEKRLGVENFTVSPLLDEEFATFVRSYVKLFQDEPGIIDEAELEKLFDPKRLPDTLVFVKVRPALLTRGEQGYTLSIDFRDKESNERLAWAEYPLPSLFQKQVQSTVTPTFFNQRIGESQLVFVVDISGSMNQPVPSRGINRLEVTKQELVRLIDSLPADRYFQILAFSGGVTAWQSTGLVVANDPNKAAAIAFVRGLSPSGGTAARAALSRSFEYRPLELVCFLSDGAPTDATPEQILADVKQRNASASVRVNTFAFEGANVPFMTELAQQNNGSYHHIQ